MNISGIYHGALCDPQKAKQCKKESCFYEFDEHGNRRGNCKSTDNPKWARKHDPEATNQEDDLSIH